MKSAAIFLLITGCLWLGASIFLALAIASLVGGAPTIVGWEDYVYVCGLIGGPLALIAGSAMVLRSSSRTGALLAALACLDLTAWAAVNIRRGHIESLTPMLLGFYAVPLLFSLLADFAAYRICRRVFSDSD